MAESSPGSADAILAALVAEARTDDGTVGLLLKGSYATGGADADPDWDLIWVLDDAVLARREADGDPLQKKREQDGVVVDVAFSSLARLQEAATTAGWWRGGLAVTKLLLDKTGEVAAVQRSLSRPDGDLATAQVREHFDSYLNGFYRSLKAWRRGDELAGRIEAAESVMYLVRTLFALERRWAPYPNRLRARLPELEAQGWRRGELQELLLELVRSGDPATQQRLEERVERLLRDRGFGDVADSWDGEIDRVRAFVF